MPHIDRRTLIQQGRKAGLNTAELYQAMAAGRPDATDVGSGRADANGYVVRLTQGGKVIYRPTK